MEPTTRPDNTGLGNAEEWWSRVSTVFEQLVDKDPEERRRQLEACEASLRKEVASLLISHDRATLSLDAPLIRIVAEDDASENGAATIVPGSAIGAYRIVREIGRGGMGIVYEAYRDDGDFRKRVALKTVSSDRSGPGLMRRFRQERRILAHLEHPNIATLIDGGVSVEGIPYFAMEYVEGVPIDSFCETRNMPLSGRLALMRQACDAVQFAHRSLVVHRDLKPGNVLVTEQGVVKLLDFGIAKVLTGDGDSGEHNESAHVTEQTDFGRGPFTLAYASPEQIRGEPVTTAADIYALGVILYRVATGRHPFENENNSSTSLRHRILAEVPAPTGHGRDLDAIVHRSMHADVGQRYETVDRLADDLRRFVAGLPVMARPDSLRYRARKFVARNRVTVAVGAVGATMLFAGAGAYAWQAQQTADERDRARMEATKAVRISGFVQEMLQSADPRIAGPELRVVDVLANAARRAEGSLQNEPAILAAVQTTIGRSYLALGSYAQAESSLTRALALHRSLGNAALNETAANLRFLATVYSERGDLQTAWRLFDESLAAYSTLPVPDSSGTADVLDALADLVQYTGALDSARVLQLRALEIRRRIGETHVESFATGLNNLAVIEGQKGRWVSAESLTRRAIAIVTDLRGAEHPSVAAAMNSLAFQLQAQGKSAAAESVYLRALEIRRRALGDDHPETARTHMNLGWMYHDTGRHREALAQAAPVLAIRPQLGDEHPAIGSTLILQGQSLVALGRVAEGERALRDALRIRENALPSGHWLLAATRSAIAEAMTAEGKYREAESLLMTAYQLLREARGDDGELTLLARRRLVRLYKAWGKPELAARYEGAGKQ